MLAAVYISGGQEVHSAPDAPDAVENSTNWTPDAPGRLLSFPTNVAFDPTIALSNNGDLMTVFSQGPSTGDSDPYVSISTNGGTSWPASPTQIFSRPGYQSNPTGVYTNDGTGHVLWVETGNDGSSAGNDFRVLYANSTNWSTTFAVISDRPDESGAVEDVDVVAYGDALYAVWSEVDEIYFASKTSAGSWTTKSVVSTAGSQTSRPAITVDINGTLHLAFVRQSFDFISLSSVFQIEYTQSTNGGSSWTSPAVLFGDLELREHVDILVDDDQIVRLVFGENTTVTNLRSTQSANNRERYVSCSSDCSQVESWGLIEHPSGSTFDVFGADPNNLIPILATNGKTTFIYFHGSENQSAPERIYGVNSCNGWNTAPGLDLVPTSGTRRAIKPSLVYSITSLHMVYENVYDDGGETRREIRYMTSPFTCTDQNFLPFFLNQ
ncbi:MAG: hypothetical protein AAF633_15340 [Chloroflexota bacterium]